MVNTLHSNPPKKNADSDPLRCLSDSISTIYLQGTAQLFCEEEDCGLNASFHTLCGNEISKCIHNEGRRVSTATLIDGFIRAEPQVHTLALPPPSLHWVLMEQDHLHQMLAPMFSDFPSSRTVSQTNSILYKLPGVRF